MTLKGSRLEEITDVGPARELEVEPGGVTDLLHLVVRRSWVRSLFSWMSKESGFLSTAYPWYRCCKDCQSRFSFNSFINSFACLSSAVQVFIATRASLQSRWAGAAL